jgi:hypothetical protein
VRASSELSARERELVALARLDGAAPLQAWRVVGTNRQLAYSTHGVFRFFGKFPPPIARHLIREFTQPGDWVLDPMMGSGTTAVEAMELERHAVVRDVSPLSTLLGRVKTRHVSKRDIQLALARVAQRLETLDPTSLPTPVDLRHANHWFLPETTVSLGRIRAAIDAESEERVRELLLTAFLSTVRRVSKATTQQGRLFLDVATAKPDAWPTFVAQVDRYAAAVASLPRTPRTRIRIEQRDAKTAPDSAARFKLAITHPPYFNNYKYSSINSLELAWLGVPRRQLRNDEVREGFKLGKPERVGDYVEDLASAVESIARELVPGGTLALMMGDTVIRDTYVNVSRRLLDEVHRRLPELGLERVVVRVPRYTEASWVASQRRAGDRIGVTLHDFILLFSKRAGAR